MNLEAELEATLELSDFHSLGIIEIPISLSLKISPKSITSSMKPPPPPRAENDYSVAERRSHFNEQGPPQIGGTQGPLAGEAQFRVLSPAPTCRSTPARSKQEPS